MALLQSYLRGTSLVFIRMGRSAAAARVSVRSLPAFEHFKHTRKPPPLAASALSPLLPGRPPSARLGLTDPAPTLSGTPPLAANGVLTSAPGSCCWSNCTPRAVLPNNSEAGIDSAEGRAARPGRCFSPTTCIVSQPPRFKIFPVVLFGQFVAFHGNFKDHRPHPSAFSAASSHAFTSSTRADATSAEFSDTDLGSLESSPFHAVQAALSKQEAPPKQSLLSMLHACNSKSDLATALKLLSETRLANAAVRDQVSNFSESMTDAVVGACLRSGEMQAALLALHPRNACGLSFSTSAAHKILRHATEQQQASAILSTLRRFQSWEHTPLSRTTTHLILTGLTATGNVERAVEVSRQLLSHGSPLKLATVDILLQATVAKGSPSLAASVLELRDQVLTTKLESEQDTRPMELHPKIGVALALAHVLTANLSAALDALKSTVQSQASENPGATVGEDLKSSLRALLQKSEQPVEASKEESEDVETQNEGKDQRSSELLASVNAFLQEIQSIPQLAQELPASVDGLLEERPLNAAS